MPISLQMLLMYYNICFLKAIMISNVKEAPNDTFKFSGEKVKQYSCKAIYTRVFWWPTRAAIDSFLITLSVLWEYFHIQYYTCTCTSFQKGKNHTKQHYLLSSVYGLNVKANSEVQIQTPLFCFLFRTIRRLWQ